MKENTQEKNLIEKSENSILGKIKKFFRNIFNKKESRINDAPVKDEKDSTKQGNEFKENIKIVENDETKILDLQKRYRRGEIGSNDLTEEQIDALSDLYDKQIEVLKEAIAEKEKQIAESKKQNIEKKNA